MGLLFVISARFPYLLFIQVICITYVSYLVNFNFHGFQETQEQYNRKKVDLEQKLLREKAELAKVSDLVKRMGERLGPGFFKKYRAFWPTTMQNYRNKRKCLHKKRAHLPHD